MKKIFLLLLLVFSIKAMQCQPLLPIVLQSEWGYIDTSGKISIAPQYEYASFFYSNSYAIVKCQNKFGLINQDNITCFGYLYDTIISLSRGYWGVKNNNKWGVITNNNKNIIPCELDSINKVDKLIKIYKNKLCGLLLNDYKVIAPKYNNIVDFSDKLFKVFVNDKWGIIDLSENYVLEPRYENIIKITDTLLRIGLEDKWGLVNLYSNFKIEPKWNRFEFFKKGYVKGYLDDRAELIKFPSMQLVSNSYDDYFEGNNNYIIVKKGFKTGIINNEGKETVKSEYDGLIFFYENYFIAENKEKRGLIDCVKGDTIVSLLYDEISVFQNDCKLKLLEVVINNKLGIVNYENKVIIPSKYTHIVCRKDSSFLVKNSSLIGLYNMSGKQIFPAQFNTIGFYENNTILARFENCYAIANRDTLLSSIRNDRIIVAARIAKLYRDDTLEVINFNDDGSIIDKFPYVGIESYKVDTRDPLPLSINYENNNRINGVEYSIEYSIKQGKWGVMDNSVKRFVNDPIYDRVYDTPRGSYKLTEIFIPPTNINIGGVSFTYHSLFGLVNLTTGLEVFKNKYIFIQNNDNNIQNSGFAIDTNGSWSFIDVAKNSISYIDANSTNSITRFYKDGHIEIGKYDEFSSVNRFRDFVNNISSRGTIWLTDSLGYTFYAQDDKYLNCLKGMWSYYAFTSPGVNINDEFKGNDDYFHAKPFEKKQAVVSKGKNAFGVLNNKKKEIIPFDFSSIRYINTGEDSGCYLVSKVIPNYGYINQKGERIIDCQYQEVKEYSENLLPVKYYGKWGFIDTTGKIIIGYNYKGVTNFFNGYSIVYDGKFYGTINSNGDTLLPLKFDFLARANDTLLLFKSKRKYGVISAIKGDTIIPAVYKNEFEFNKNGLAVVKADDGFGVINTKGKMVINDKYDKLGNISPNNVVWAKSKKNYKLLNAVSGKKLSNHYAKLYDESNALIVYKGRKLFGYLDTNGNEFIKEKYRKSEPFIGDFAIVKEKKYFGTIDIHGNDKIPFEWESLENLGDHFLAKTPKGNYSVINNEGNTLFPLNNLKIISGFTDGLAIAQNKRGEIFFIDEKGENKLNVHFDEAKPFNGTLARVKIKDKWGIINKEGKFVLPPLYYNINDFKDGIAAVSISPVYGVYLINGIKIIEPQYEEIIPLNNTLFFVKKDNKIGYFKSNGSWLWPLQ